MNRSKRPARWQAEKAATAKALRDWPRCSTQGCEGKALGILLGYDLCVTCQIKRLRESRDDAQRES